MCEPATIFYGVGMGIAALSAASQVSNQRQMMKAQGEYNVRETENIRTAMSENYAQIGLQESQATEQATQKLQENDLAAQRAISTAKVSAGESGVSGLSVDELLANLDGTRGNYNASVLGNLSDLSGTFASQRMNVRNGGASQINQLRTPQAPDYLGATLKIASAANNFYAGTQPPKAGGKNG